MASIPLNLLRQVFGADVPESMLYDLVAAADQRSFAPGTIILAQGEPGHTCHILTSGLVEVSQRAADSREQRVLTELTPGHFFGELALLDSAPRMATCRAVTAVTTLAFNQTSFNQLLAQNPALGSTLLQQVVAEMRRQDQLAIDDLEHKNVALQQAYADLKAAQADLLEKERLEHELALAAAVQQGLLPVALPRYEAYQFAAFQHPARQVGGDFYDVIDLDEEHTGILMADVADKGMHAALIMAVTRTLFRVIAASNQSPAAVAVAVHQGLLDVAPEQDTFVTAFYGVLHRPSGTLTYVRAAQERPLLAHADGRVSALPGEGRFIGMLPKLALDEAQLTLSHGDRLLLFSDGVTDAMNAAGDPYDNERLRAACARHVSLPAGRFVRAVLDDVRGWIGSAPPFDDLTLLAVEVRDPMEESLGY